MTDAKPMLYFALDYAARGWAVFPCSPLTKRPLVGRDEVNGVKVDGTGGVKKATKDRLQIEKWWCDWPNAMIGVACGSASNIWAIDPDAPKKLGLPDGRANWAALQQKHGCAWVGDLVLAPNRELPRECRSKWLNTRESDPTLSEGALQQESPAHHRAS
ncbi:bifunctional DNA primase/polymerase [Bradyrhizobium viridifuturi]|uniref:bifunctional DNA primase/polymerase n=1 Tax=Bradyrhizobium viridifuturi TaxID=1654716 RepID=UPI00067F2D9B|nr:bifunctional DNA primase/polymerase [Bradyrhizobium viridifuturi]